MRKLNHVIEKLKELEEALDADSIKKDWEDDEIAMEIDWLYGEIYKLRKDLEKSE